MSSTPIFDQMVSEYSERGISYERLIQPYLEPVRPKMTVHAPSPVKSEMRLPGSEPKLVKTSVDLEPDEELNKRIENHFAFNSEKTTVIAPEPVFEETDPNAEAVELDGKEILEEVVEVARTYGGSEYRWLAREVLDELHVEDVKRGTFEKQVMDYFSESEGEVDQTLMLRKKGDKMPGEVETVRMTGNISEQAIVEGVSVRDFVDTLREEFFKKYPDVDPETVHIDSREDKIRGEIDYVIHGQRVPEKGELVSVKPLWSARDEE